MIMELIYNIISNVIGIGITLLLMAYISIWLVIKIKKLLKKK